MVGLTHHAKFVKYSGRNVTQVPLGAEGVRGNSRERRNASAFGSSSEFALIKMCIIYKHTR